MLRQRPKVLQELKNLKLTPELKKQILDGSDARLESESFEFYKMRRKLKKDLLKYGKYL